MEGMKKRVCCFFMSDINLFPDHNSKKTIGSCSEKRKSAQNKTEQTSQELGAWAYTEQVAHGLLVI